MHHKARWGDHEDHLMLQAVLAESGEEVTDTPVRHFQATRGLEPDNKLGDNTRRAIITEYMAVDGTTLPEGIDPTAHGCGENFPLDPDDPPDHTHDRRVELFFFDPDLGILPPPPGDLSPPDSPEYPEWRRRATETHTFQIRQIPGMDLQVVDDSEVALPRVAYRLTTTDGQLVTGRSDDSGVARIVGVPAGECSIELSHIDLGLSQEP
jgi:hypothetical protein